jgi:hypothetical protein
MSVLGTQRLFVLTRFPRFVVMDGASGVDSVLIRIIVADSQAVYRVGLIEVLSSEINMRVVAQANTLEAVHRAVERFFSQSLTQGASPRAIILLEGNMMSGTVDAFQSWHSVRRRRRLSPSWTRRTSPALSSYTVEGCEESGHVSVPNEHMQS